VKNAARISHHAPPHSLCAKARPGNSSEFIRLSTLSTPNPVITPQKVSTRKVPRMAIESITDRGTLRLGSLVSSARGAAASHPVRPWTESTTASVKPDRASLLPKSKTDSENPPGPGLAKPEMARASTIRISAPPRISSALAESSMPRCWRNAVSGAPTRRKAHHSHGRSTL
jgi:hypothetical protein